MVATPDFISRPPAAERIVQRALRILEREMRSPGPAMASPRCVRDYLRLALAGREREVFVALLLDAQHRVVAIDELFHGTFNQTTVVPREVVKAALGRNAAAVIFAHNHPAGLAEPSQVDELITKQLRDALALVDVKVLDHFIVAGTQCMSFAERGLL